jgi:hypothetical protein
MLMKNRVTQDVNTTQPRMGTAILDYLTTNYLQSKVIKSDIVYCGIS